MAMSHLFEFQQIRAVLAMSSTEGLVAFFQSLGFTSVSLDLEGLVSGKLNRTHGSDNNRPSGQVVIGDG